MRPGSSLHLDRYGGPREALPGGAVQDQFQSMNAIS